MERTLRHKDLEELTAELRQGLTAELRQRLSLTTLGEDTPGRELCEGTEARNIMLAVADNIQHAKENVYVKYC